MDHIGTLKPPTDFFLPNKIENPFLRIFVNMRNRLGFSSNLSGFLLWFTLAGVASLIIRPFEIPIWGDRSYLLYMSQVVFRGDSVYQATTFGYPPFTPVIAGYIMKGLSVLGIEVNTVLTIRTLGLILYSVICGSFFVLVNTVFKERKAAHLAALALMSLGFLQLNSASNFEPKLLALAFEIWTFYFVLQRKWLWAGIMIAFAAMCWQPMVINGIAIGIYLLLTERKKGELLSTLTWLSLGVVLGVIPSLLYVLGTDSWSEFWAQAVLRKTDVEGAVLFEKPFNWIKRFVASKYQSEAAFLLFGYLGIIYLIVKVLLKQASQIHLFRITKAALLFSVLFIFWAVFNSMEFQGSYDGTPMIPMLLIAGVALFWQFTSKWITQSRWIIFVIITSIYACFDLFFPLHEMTHTEQKAWIEDLHAKWGDAFTFNFEEFYVLREQPMPTKYLRYAPFDDYLIDKVEKNGCADIIQKINEDKPKALIGFYSNAKNGSLGSCGHKIIETFSDPNHYESISIPVQKKHALSSEIIVKQYRVYPTIFSTPKISEEQ